MKYTFITLVSLAVSLACACTPQEQQVAVSTIPTDICIVTTTATDVNQNMSAPDIIADVLKKCGGTVQDIANVLDAENKAQIVGTGGDSTKNAAYHQKLADISAEARKTK